MSIQLLDTTILENNLTSVANTIRTKLNDQTGLSFPEGFVNNINTNIYNINDWLDKSKPVGDIYFNGFIGTYSLSGRNKIGKLFARTGTYVDASGMASCSATMLIGPNLYTIYTGGCSSCTSLTTVDFGGTPSSSRGFIRTNGLKGCTKLTTVILRGNGVWTLSNINNFENTPFASGKAGGTLYVPRAQIDAYKAAAGWSTILGYTKTDGETLQNNIVAIEDSIYQVQYADGTPLPNASRSENGLLYIPKMSIDMNNRSMVTILQTDYGAMENLEELTFTGVARATYPQDNICNTQGLFTAEKYPSLKKIYIQPSEIRMSSNGSNLKDPQTISFGHYPFTNTNLSELVIGSIGGPYMGGGGYYRQDMNTQVGSPDGLTLTVYRAGYHDRGGFGNGTLASNTTLICRDYLTGEILTGS